MISYKLRSAACYIAFGVALYSIAPEPFGWREIMLFISLYLLLVAIDVDSYREGLTQGTEMAAEHVRDTLTAMRGGAR